ncbi:phospholipase D-like domain-containing protein [Leptothrix discophora]|uniref:PLD phosphodiesterase domain-containing protein n=1 Tax=Leptothrix discophora TaxID=89 RepID=A0ABT9G1A0_LEPDI|nr:hypothetical protein [Leptothrix discophora]MDP4300195.1 hypothetical protein [Leptothrix discophora]
MPDLMSPQTVLTPGDAASQLQSRGLAALGLVAPALATGWASSTPSATDLDADTLRLTLASPRAPFQALHRTLAQAPLYADVAGASLAGPVVELRLHPEAARRLGRLVAQRLGGPLIRPVPVAMLVHGVPAPPATPQPVDWLEAGAPLGLPGSLAVSFHDARGLPICPLAAAALFADLLTAFPALGHGDATMPARGAAGGIDGIVASAPAAVRIHVIDPHGRVFVPSRPEARLKVVTGAGVEIQPVPDAGLVTLPPGMSLGRASGDAPADSTAANPLHWGWAHDSTLARSALAPPASPAGVSLPRQFLRVVAVDLAWHLRGNRGDSVIANVPGDDGAVPDFALPVVRNAVPNFDYLSDGMDVLGACAQAASGFPPAGVDVQALLCSPAIEPTLALPPGPGAAGSWPAFPAPNPGGGLPASADATAGLAAAFRAPGDAADARLDVVVTVAADAVPAGTHLRVYPRRFVQIDAIDGEQPSFLRGDGGAALAQAGQPSRMLLRNPYGLASAAPLPSPALLLVDVVAVGRDGQRRLHSGIELTVSATTASFTPDPAAFGGEALLQRPAVAALLAAFGSTAVAPASLFGIAPPAAAPAPAPGNFLDLVRRLANETSAPRIGPHLPTQARFDTVLALGAAPAASQPLAWRAVLTGARWREESRSARPERGDPGNPPGPDLHAAGVRVDGQLAQDLALHALKRAQPVIPLGPTTPGWLVALGGNNWNDAPADVSGTVSAVMLETVAAFCDSPELGLSAIPIPQPADSIQTAVNALAGLLGVGAPSLNLANEARLKRALQREMVTARRGQRDALWSLLRAVEQAREFVYIEGPAFARTARPSGTPAAHEVDLVERLRARLAANPRLKVMVCVPRWPDMDPALAPWVRTALAHRKAAVETLTSQDRQRVAAFHPIGFPGRPAVLRSSVVIVDDVYALVGTSHWRRRGMTFDGGCDVASIDRQLDAHGRSTGIVRFRQELMAARLGIALPSGPSDSTPLWTRLAEPEAAFDLLADLLSQGGLGRCSPVWAGPSDTRVIAQTDAKADPDGVDADGSRLFSDLIGLLGSA